MAVSPIYLGQALLGIWSNSAAAACASWRIEKAKSKRSSDLGHAAFRFGSLYRSRPQRPQWLDRVSGALCTWPAQASM